MTVSDYEHLQCSWCRSTSPLGSTSCATCGAPLAQAALVSDAGWRAAPRIRDTTRFGFSNSTVEVEGEIVPVAEVDLAAGDGLFFEAHTLLWKTESMGLGSMNLGGGLGRLFGGMPMVITTVAGPGKIAFARDSAGELVVLPLHPEMEIDVREHAFLVGTHTVAYDFVKIDGLKNMLHGGSGMYMDRFRTHGQQGLVMLHGSGNVFEKQLAAGESIHVEPGAFLYKDASVTMQVEKQDVKTSALGKGLYLVKMTGPGRLGIQSMYHPHLGSSE